MAQLETVSRVIVDTDVVVDYLRGRQPGESLYSKWRKKVKVVLTSVVAFELLLGAKLSSKREERLSEVQSLLDQHEISSFDADAAHVASDIGAELRKKEQTMEVRDLLNASICVAKHMPMLTKNRSHYERVAALRVVT